MARAAWDQTAAVVQALAGGDDPRAYNPLRPESQTMREVRIKYNPQIMEQLHTSGRVDPKLLEMMG
jgi:hypothetical protein